MYSSWLKYYCNRLNGKNDTFRAVVKGVIRGAKTVRINPTGNDTYETVLEIDRDMMMALLRNARRS